MSYGRCHGDVVVSKDGRYVYTASYYQGNVARFDVANGNSLTTLRVGPWATDLYMTPDGNRILAHYGQSNPRADTSLAVINVEGSAFASAGSVALGGPGLGDWASGPITFSSDSSHAYVPVAKHGSGKAALLDISLSSLSIARSLVFDVERLNGAVRLGDRLYVASEDQKKIYGVNLVNFSALRDTIDLRYSPNGIALHPDRRHLFVLHPQEGAISVVDLETKTTQVGLTGLSSPSDIEFSADGSTAYVGRMYRAGGPALGGVTVLDVKGSQILADDFQGETLDKRLWRLGHGHLWGLDTTAGRICRIKVDGTAAERAAGDTKLEMPPKSPQSPQ
jgi:DNA-binding beta-propeller fold protein YncE